jgi:small subunit ribosomal protein S5
MENTTNNNGPKEENKEVKMVRDNPRDNSRRPMTRKPFDKNRPRKPMMKKDGGNLFTKILEVSRVGATNAGGKIISYAAFSVVGNEKGSVGLGLGKAKEVSAAVEKSKALAKKNMITLPLKHLETIPHNAEVKYRGTRVILRKGNKGHIASNLAKTIFKAAGLKNMVSKALGARSVKNTAYAIMKCLKNIESPLMIAQRRNLKLEELMERKKNVIAYGLMRQNKNKKNVQKDKE